MGKYFEEMKKVYKVKKENSYILINIEEVKRKLNIPSSYNLSKILSRIVKPYIKFLKEELEVYRVDYERGDYKRVIEIKVSFKKGLINTNFISEFDRMEKKQQKDFEDCEEEIIKKLETKNLKIDTRTEFEKIQKAKIKELKRSKSLTKKEFKEVKKQILKLDTIEDIKNCISFVFANK